MQSYIPSQAVLVYDALLRTPQPRPSNATSSILAAARENAPSYEARLASVLQLISACWLLAYLVSLVGWRYAVPRSVKTKLRFLTQDIVTLAAINNDFVHRQHVKWKAITSTLLSGLRLALAVTILVITLVATHESKTWSHCALLLLTCLAWLLATLYAFTHPSITPRYGLLLFYTLDGLEGVFRLSYTRSASFGILPSQCIALAATLGLVAIQMSLPMEAILPSPKVAGTLKSHKHPSRSLDSPEDGVSLCSWLLVTWMRPLLATAQKGTLQDTDVWQLSPYFRHYIIYPVFRDLMPKASLIRRIYAFSAFDLVITSTCTVVFAMLNFASPYFLKKILEALSTDDPELRKTAYRLALLSFLFAALRAEVDLVRTWHGRRSYERTRGVLITMIFDKATRKKDRSGSLGHRKLDKDEQAAEGADAGRILNLMNGDAYSVAQWFWEISSIVRLPIDLCIAAVFLYQILGYSALVGLLPIFLGHGIITLLGKRQLALQRAILSTTDKRIAVIAELVAAIRFLKYYAWERIWVDKAIAAREKELAVRYKLNFNSAWFTLTFIVVPNLMIFTTFWCYTKVAGKQLTIPVAFASLSLFGMILQPLIELPGKVMFYLNTLISVRRLERFLAEEEMQDSDNLRGSSRHDRSIAFDEAVFVYPQQDVPDESAGKPFELHCPSFEIPTGKLSLVCGGNASGKSTVLMTLLGETDCLSGRLIRPNYPGAYALVTQDSWLEQATIKDNILFGADYDAERFDAVLDACALKPDLARFDAREDTEIGERGISLSGGQRARVALARAVYSAAGIVLLDDPLSAVDAHTAKHIVEHCFAGPLMAGRTIVLVTHHVKLCYGRASLIIRLEDGQVAVTDTVRLEAVTTASEPALDVDSENETLVVSESTKAARTTMPATPANGSLITKENRAEGSVKWLVYKMYLKAAGKETWIGILTFLLLGRILTITQQRFLERWGESYNESRLPWLPPASQNVNPWLLSYFGFSLISATTYLGRLAFTYHGSFKAARTLLYICLLRVVNAPSRWLDENPTGRLINRFTADIGSVDNTINQSVTAVFDDLIGVVGSLGAVVYVVPRFIVFAVAAIVLYSIIASPYVACSRDLRRLENNHRSPLFSRFGGLLRGLKVVRAFGQQARYVDLLNSDLDLFQSMDHFFWTARFYLSLRFDIVGALAVYVLTLVALAGGVSQGSAAFAIILANQFVYYLHASIWSYAKLELDVNSIERIHDLMETPQEPPSHIEGARLPAHWPATGSIHVENLAVRYAPHLPLALNGISFSVSPGQKIGIVGRSGSGKTTLALSFLRIMEPAAGSILIDGVDIAGIGLADLRQRVTIISQDSTLFEGSVRSNLDPDDRHADHELWSVLKRVGMHVDSIDAAVTAGGENFSQGERQLLSIARAVLRRSNVFIADEATASVSFETDERVQRTLRTELAGATVITIAHRLRTVIDVDRVLVMQDGVLQESGAPRDLLKDSSSAFYKLCEQSSELDELTRLAGMQ